MKRVPRWRTGFTVTLLQIVMVSPWTQSSQSPKLKMLGPLCKQTVNLETDTKTLYYSLLILKHSSCIY